MKIAVVTPVGPSTDPKHLQRCHDSVRQQDHPATHIVVQDGGDVPVYGAVETIRLTTPAADFGDTPRAIGSIYAFNSLGFDAVAWLDADNWYLPRHLTGLVRAHHETGFPVITSGRLVADYLRKHEPQPCVEQVTGGTLQWDTSTYLVAREAKHLAAAWGAIPDQYHVIGDRIIGQAAKQEELAHCTYEPTVIYRSRLKFHYDQYGWDAAGVDLETK